MRSLVSWLVGGVLAAAVCFVAPGCGNATSELEKPPEIKKQPDLMTDMPGYKEMQDSAKKAGKK